MIIKLSDSLIGTLYHDVDGNLYININNNNINNEYYYLRIDKNDDLIFEHIECFDNLIEVNAKDIINYNTIKQNQNPFSLENFVSRKIEENEDKEDNNSDDGAQNYYPEEKYYYIDENNSNNNSDSEESEYKFSKFGDEIIKCLDRSLDSPSEYDIFILDTSTMKVLFTSESNQKNPYRVTINLSNIFELNIVGSKVKSYHIEIDHESLEPIFRKIGIKNTF